MQILYVAPFIPCYILEILKHIFSFCQGDLRQIIDICFVVLIHQSTELGPIMDRCVQQKKQKMKFWLHPNTSVWQESHRGLCSFCSCLKGSQLSSLKKSGKTLSTQDKVCGRAEGLLRC